MADGYIENGAEYLASIKHMSLGMHDYEAIRVLDEIIETIIPELNKMNVSDERKIRRAFFWGAEVGSRVLGLTAKLALEVQRQEQKKMQPRDN